MSIFWRDTAGEAFHLTDIRQVSANRHMRLHTSIMLRWLAVAGQSLAVMFVHFGLGYELPLIWCFIPIVLSANLNITLSILFPATKRMPTLYAGLLLAYDLLQLATIFYFTGGLQNPFVFLFLVPVCVSATILPRNSTILLGILSIGLISILGFIHQPLPWLSGETFIIPNMYMIALWASLVLVMLFLAIYVGRISSESYAMLAALSATEIMLEREQKLSALDGLAAAAAHELGTPLSTITLVAKELKYELSDKPELHDDLELLAEQATRCRRILAELQARKNEFRDDFLDFEITEMMDDLISNHRMADSDIWVNVIADDEFSTPKLHRNPAFLYALGNLVNNAAEFADHKVVVELDWSDKKVSIHIADDGAGFSADIVDQLGEPFISTRVVSSESLASGEHHGMGLGFFIAKTVLERSGAHMLIDDDISQKPMGEFKHRHENMKGAHIQLVWRRADFEKIGQQD
ncbi:MAG: ActS/PrrB/RegB family redox-sensitive histidine kinase [Rhizobiales bacterium]|nr:ActS/PrrB/RegB family redox-sensitive histidine kinase [Hyphomicrobiales bacterium]NRB15947.1 ActS/PrrB/RegB family redox-sensitive histidine kinase [Hyphomicrobiales bacterium]